MMDYALPGPPAMWLAIACLAGTLLALAAVWMVNRWTGWPMGRGR